MLRRTPEETDIGYATEMGMADDRQGHDLRQVGAALPGCAQAACSCEVPQGHWPSVYLTVAVATVGQMLHEGSGLNKCISLLAPEWAHS